MTAPARLGVLLALFLAGFAVSPLVFGPLSDRLPLAISRHTAPRWLTATNR